VHLLNNSVILKKSFSYFKLCIKVVSLSGLRLVLEEFQNFDYAIVCSFTHTTQNFGEL